VKLEELLGRRVRYKGEEGRIVGGHAVAQAEAMAIVSICRKRRAPRRELTVPEAEWGELEFLD